MKFFKAVLFLFYFLATSAHAGYEAIETIGTQFYPTDTPCDGARSPVSGSCSFSYSSPVNTTPFSYSASVQSYGDATGLHALANSTVSGYGGIVASATEELTDDIQLTGRQSFYGILSMTLTTHGSETNGSAYSQLGLGSVEAVPNTGSGVCYFYNGGTCTVSFEVELSAFLNLDVLLNAETVNAVSGATIVGSANFGNTSFISALNFTDLNGDPISVGYTSSDGLAYPMSESVAAVPEPTVYALMLGGVGLIYWTTKPRRRRWPIKDSDISTNTIA